MDTNKHRQECYMNLSSFRLITCVITIQSTQTSHHVWDEDTIMHYFLVRKKLTLFACKISLNFCNAKEIIYGHESGYVFEPSCKVVTWMVIGL